MTKRVCIRFDWLNDRHARQLLGAWLANREIPFTYTDLSAGQLTIDNVARVKDRLTAQIRAATHTLALIGASANGWHQVSEEIGTRGWIWSILEASNDSWRVFVDVSPL